MYSLSLPKEYNPQVETTPPYSIPLQDSIPVLPINLQANASSGMVPKDVTFKVLYVMDSDYKKEILKVSKFLLSINDVYCNSIKKY